MKEHNAAADRNEAAIAEIVRMFGEDFCFERDRGQDSYSNPATARVLDRVRERMARVASLEQDLLTGSLPGLFRALEDKLFEIQLAREAVIVTVNIPSVARQLKGLPADLQQAAIDAREWVKKRTKRESAKHSIDVRNKPIFDTEAWAGNQYKGKPFDKMRWNPRCAARELEPSIRAHAKGLGWDMTEDETGRRETIEKWFRKIEHARNPSYGKKRKTSV